VTEDNAKSNVFSVVFVVEGLQCAVVESGDGAVGALDRDVPDGAPLEAMDAPWDDFMRPSWPKFRGKNYSAINSSPATGLFICRSTPD
jgi:hypothetical protein